MTKEEFLSRIKDKKAYISNEMWENIQTVYTYHPSIDAVYGKDDIATLFDIGGTRIIKDMLPTALKAKKYEEEISKKDSELVFLRFELLQLSV